MGTNDTIIFIQEIFKDLITLLNSYARDQFARLAIRVSCESYLETGNFTINIAVDLSDSRE